MLIFSYLLSLALVSWASWKLSGFEAHLMPQEPARLLRKRGIRCVLTFPMTALVLLEIFQGKGSFLIVVCGLILAVLWVGPGSSLASDCFQRLLFSDSNEGEPLESYLQNCQLSDQPAQPAGASG